MTISDTLLVTGPFFNQQSIGRAQITPTGGVQQSLADAIGGLGRQIYVNAATGNDGNGGTASAPFATLSAAQNAVTANSGATVYVSGTVYETATVNWAKNGVNLVGIQAPSDNDRARISSTGATPFSPLMNVTATGCAFENIGAFHGGFTGATGSQVCWAEAGGNNVYSGVQFLGGGDATMAALVGCRSLTIAGNGENRFTDCTFGLDTVTRLNASATLEFLVGSARNIFLRPIFQMYAGDATEMHIKALAGTNDRYATFFSAMLLNAVDSGATAINAAVVNSSSSSIVFDIGLQSVGVIAIATTGPVYIANALAAGTSGVGLKAT
jgi:hypothetical protein